MNSIDNDLFGPLSKEYCIWFYILSILGFVSFIVFFITSIVLGIKNKKNTDYYVTVVGVSMFYLVAYFQNRLLYTMCIS